MRQLSIVSRFLLLSLVVLTLAALGCNPINYTSDFYSDDVNVQVISVERRSVNSAFVVQLKNLTDEAYRWVNVEAVCYDPGSRGAPGLATPAPKRHNTVGVLTSAERITLRAFATQTVSLKGTLAPGTDADTYCKVVLIEALRSLPGL